jgi:predicted RNase H-like HicB family nuclease
MLADLNGMQHVSRWVSQYRIVLDRAEDGTFVARCPEMPGCCARALNVDAVVNLLRESMEAEVQALLAEGNAPAPLRESEGRLGAWMRDLELVGERPTIATTNIEKPLPSALHAIAQWTIDRYRIVLEEDETEGFVATSTEMPDVLGYGLTATSAAADLRARLEDRAFKMLSGNRIPPEPVRDVEAREKRRQWEQGRPPMALAA